MNKSQSANARERWLKRIPAVLILAFLSYRFLSLQNFKAPKHLDRSRLVLKSLDGSPIDSKVFQGKALVLNYWAPWCAPCRIEMPWLGKLQNEHKNDLLVVGIVADSNEYSHAPQFMQQHGFQYALGQDSEGLHAQIGGVGALPTTFYVTRSGDVVHTVTGIIPEILMKRYAADAMQQK
jgi:cytochrome c biogenesis protein CcmG/thiol:disulfide interchange protein DsbE